jgi:hypothetical protein
VSEAWPWGRALTWPEVAHAGERRLSLIAGPEERAAVARALDLVDLTCLQANLVVRPWLDGLEIEGRVDARATRICGVSLDPFEVDIDEPLRIRVLPPGSPNAPRADSHEITVDLDAEDPPDEADGDVVDLGAYVVETLALALDPFPRKPGAVFEAPEEKPSISPFAALARLSDRPLSE